MSIGIYHYDQLRITGQNLNLAEMALEKQNADAFDLAAKLIGKDIASLPTKVFQRVNSILV